MNNVIDTDKICNKDYNYKIKNLTPFSVLKRSIKADFFIIKVKQYLIFYKTRLFRHKSSIFWIQNIISRFI